MRRKSTSLTGILILLLGLFITGIVVGASPASAATCTGPMNGTTAYHDAWSSNSQLRPGGPAVYGVAAYVVYELPSLCSGNNTGANFGSSWTMVADNRANGGWAQSGMTYSRAQSCMEHFAQSNITFNGTPQNVIYGYPNGHCAANDQVHQAWTVYDATNHRFAMNIDATTLLVTSWDPNIIWGFGPGIDIQYSSEVSSLASNMPGNSARRTNYTTMEYQSTLGAQFADACNVYLDAYNDNPSHWGQFPNSCDNVSVWTSVAQ